jgi:hypothetical protein
MLTLIDTLTLRDRERGGLEVFVYNHRKLAQNNAVVNQNKRNGPGRIVKIAPEEEDD